MSPLPPVPSGKDAQGLGSANLVESLRDELLNVDKYGQDPGSKLPEHNLTGLQPIGLGPRVPMLVISPWSTGGWACSQLFHHTSVLQFLEARIGVSEPNISQWRRAVCGDLTAAFDSRHKLVSGREDLKDLEQRRYSVSAGDTVSDLWTTASEALYRLTVQGPNGAHYEFAGSHAGAG